jgi:hypothetical protein
MKLLQLRRYLTLHQQVLDLVLPQQLQQHYPTPHLSLLLLLLLFHHLPLQTPCLKLLPL